jgi:hypothetical protein
LALAQIKNYAALSPVEVLILHMTRKKCKHKLLVKWMFKEAVDLLIFVKEGNLHGLGECVFH